MTTNEIVITAVFIYDVLILLALIAMLRSGAFHRKAMANIYRSLLPKQNVEYLTHTLIGKKYNDHRKGNIMDLFYSVDWRGDYNERVSKVLINSLVLSRRRAFWRCVFFLSPAKAYRVSLQKVLLPEHKRYRKYKKLNPAVRVRWYTGVQPTVYH